MFGFLNKEEPASALTTHFGDRHQHDERHEAEPMPESSS
jgi:hypothetical protein